MNPVQATHSALLKKIEGKNVPVTVNYPNDRDVLFAYCGDDRELFSQAIR